MAGPAQSGTRSFVAVVGALVAVVAVVVLVVRASRPPEPVETGPAMTTVTIVSDPAGATVTDADGGLLGVAPFDLTVPKRDAELPVVVRREGYQEQPVDDPAVLGHRARRREVVGHRREAAAAAEAAAEGLVALAAVEPASLGASVGRPRRRRRPAPRRLSPPAPPAPAPPPPAPPPPSPLPPAARRQRPRPRPARACA